MTDSNDEYLSPAKLVRVVPLRVRVVEDGDEGPFLQGNIKCEHESLGSPSAQTCLRCNGSGWFSGSVMLELELSV